MNTPYLNSDHIAHGSVEMIRECAAECLQMAAFYASSGVGYVDALDDAGFDYSIRRAVAHLRQAVRLAAMLQLAKRQNAEHPGDEPTAEALEDFGR
ncbi:hypothetical protein [Methylobacterium isbiliense]|uniref:Uncharacterized protein n=1 Tax=Methylobacterium isbiliense TaxID=315478 RepID=A0ABQ4SPZ7_9HYPH|nr:hypothetical protein [Methylobacterium isbiliense]MDN3627770.1 hypothetical protein [Methylobacterium isbiliense]GJE04366.1 hypothetical protein GMJLKIPL_6327 [Methylobacterium isbiliense]